MALYEKIFFMFRVRKQDQDRGVRKMDIMKGLDQFFLFDDGGMRDGLEELSMAEQARRQKAAFPERLKALCIHGKTVIRSLFAHPHAPLENTMSQGTVPSGVDAQRAATGACGPCLQRIRFFLSRITAMVVSVNNNIPHAGNW
jgi:hypothetical protein